MTEEQTGAPIEGTREETLDPQDWAAMRALGHRALDDALDHLESLRERPVWQHAPEHVKAHFRGAPPVDPQPAEDVYQEYVECVLPHQLGNSHPRFWGWVIGSGTAMGVFAEMLAAAADAMSGIYSYLSNNYVELQVLDWCKTLLGFPSTASGLLTSGCSASNLIALAVARNEKAGFDLRGEGMAGAPRPLTVYCSQEAHSSLTKAVELLGLGSDSLRRVPVDGSMRIDLRALREAVARDRADGLHPICVVGVAGTTNTGPWMTSRVSPTSARRRGCGSTSTAPSAPGLPSPRSPGAWWPGWRERIRWPSTCTNGCT